MNRAYLSLGSNQGDRLAYLRDAVAALAAADGIDVVKLSSVYETDPVGYVDQPAFLNLVVALETELDPLALLDGCQHVEERFGRTREVRWGPRTIDVDVLLYGEQRIATDRLIVPHPRMGERAFVLVPLIEVSSDAVVAGESVGRLLDALKDEEDQGVALYASTAGWLE